MAARIRTIFAENLKRLRLKRGISQEKLALDAGVERAYVGLIERQKSSPTIDMVAKIARVLGVEPAKLLEAPRAKRG
ncbi:MAG: transcriptional regulator [Herminiimonas sp.]|nr:transcriptional regulator [Herminiimonas sp.]